MNYVNDWCSCKEVVSVTMKDKGCSCTTQYKHYHCNDCGKVVEVILPSGEVRKSKEWK